MISYIARGNTTKVGLIDCLSTLIETCVVLLSSCPRRDGMWYVLLTTMVGATFSFFAVVHLSSHENGTGAEDTPRLPVNRRGVAFQAGENTKMHYRFCFVLLNSLVLHPGRATIEKVLV